MVTSKKSKKLALVTGAARRIGVDISRTLHENGFDLVLHYHESAEEAEGLCDELNARRQDSVFTLCADLRKIDELEKVFEKISVRHKGLDLLVNNASSFYPTEFASTTVQQWEDLMNTNLRAPFFLCQAAAELLRSSKGSIVNIIDIIAERPRPGYAAYSVSRAGLVSLTKALAGELAPEVRVNAVSPGAILWPESDAELDEAAKQEIIANNPLGRLGTPADIAEAVLYLADEAAYITGQVISVDGGSSLKQG